MRYNGQTCITPAHPMQKQCPHHARIGSTHGWVDCFCIRNTPIALRTCPVSRLALAPGLPGESAIGCVAGNGVDGSVTVDDVLALATANTQTHNCQGGSKLANTPATLGLVPASNPISTPSLGPPTNSAPAKSAPVNPANFGPAGPLDKVTQLECLRHLDFIQIFFVSCNAATLVTPLDKQIDR